MENSEAAAAPTLTDVDKARMRALRNVYYHCFRVAHYARLERWSLLSIAILAIGAVLQVPSIWGGYGVAVWGVLIATISIYVLVVSPVDKCGDHRELQKRASELARAAKDGTRTPENVEYMLTLIYGEEGRTMHAVNAMAYNEVQKTYKRPESTYIPIGTADRLLGNWWPFTAERYHRSMTAKTAVSETA